MTIKEKVLAMFSRTSLEDLVGRRIQYVHIDADRLILITDNNTYVVFEWRGTYDNVKLEECKLCMTDLRIMGVIKESTWNEHQVEEAEENRPAQQEAERRFRYAAERVGLGVAVVEKILNEHLTK